MRDHANDNETDRLIAAADAAFRALVGWMPMGVIDRSADQHASVLDDPLLILVRAGHGVRRRDVETAVRRCRRSAIIVSVTDKGRFAIGTIKLAAYAQPIEWFTTLRLWITPYADTVWLVDASRGDRPPLPVFQFVGSGFEAHWVYPWQQTRDRAPGYRHAALAFGRLVASFL